MIAAIVLSVAALMLPFINNNTSAALVLGDVAQQDILAPWAHSYESEILTNRQKEQAAANVSAVYAPPDTSIAREQIENLRNALNYISVVRQDEFSTPEQKAADLAAMKYLNLAPETIQRLLELDEDNWQIVQQESTVVLEQIMRSTIREDRLEEARRSVPALVSFAMTEEDTQLVSLIVTPLVAPNSLYSEALTNEQREGARNAVEPIIRSFVTNQTVVERGRLITEEDLEALEQFGLQQTQVTWENYVGASAIVLASFGFIAMYLQYRRDLLLDLRGLLTMTVLFLIFLYGARLTIPFRTVVPYIYPIAGYSLLISALISPPAGRVFALPLGILAAYGLTDNLELTLYYVLTSSFGVLALRNSQRISTFLWSGIVISISGMAVILAFRLADSSTDVLGLATLLGATIIYSLGSVGLAVLLQFLLAQTLGLTTTLQLIELSRPDNSLMQFILRNAPGTYQHSLQVANLAEQAAELIDADTLLTRVGALYHDAGKALNPHYFIENQQPGSRNPHKALSPIDSSEVIIRHVTDGVKLAEKHKLPKRIIDFIWEHHGTLVTRFQYIKAIETEEGDTQRIEIDKFRYPGPRPQSVETALVMLADGCEARSRAERPQSADAVRVIVEDIIRDRLDEGQLDDTKLTLSDLSIISESFTTTLKGIYHPRIKYPSLEAATRPREDVLNERDL